MAEWQPKGQLPVAYASTRFSYALFAFTYLYLIYNPHSDAFATTLPPTLSNPSAIVRLLVNGFLETLPVGETDDALRILSVKGLSPALVQRITSRLSSSTFSATALPLLTTFAKRGVEPRLVAAVYGVPPGAHFFAGAQTAPYWPPRAADGLDVFGTNCSPTYPASPAFLHLSTSHEPLSGSRKKRKSHKMSRQQALETNFAHSSQQKESQAEQMPDRVIRLPNVYGLPATVVETSTEQVAPLQAPYRTVPFWTLAAESYTILSTLYGSSDAKIIGKRVDHVPSHLSLLSGLMGTTLVIRFHQEFQGGVQCSAGESRSKLNVFFPYVEAWCSNLLGWTVTTAPAIAESIGDTSFLVSAIFKKELICNAVKLPKFKGERVVNHEVLWGCFEDLGPLALPKDLHALLTSWSRVTIIQSRRITSQFRNYITEQYLHQASAASKFIEKVETACPVEELLLQKSQQVSNVVVHWPPGFTFNYVYQATLPICLAVYPINTHLAFDLKDPTNPKTPRHFSYICDGTKGFVPQTMSELPKA